MNATDHRSQIYSACQQKTLYTVGGHLENGYALGESKEFYLLFQVFDESNSHYLDRNIRVFTQTDPGSFDKEDAGFLESNLMHGKNIAAVTFAEWLECLSLDREVPSLIPDRVKPKTDNLYPFLPCLTLNIGECGGL